MTRLFTVLAVLLLLCSSVPAFAGDEAPGGAPQTAAPVLNLGSLLHSYTPPAPEKAVKDSTLGIEPYSAARQASSKEDIPSGEVKTDMVKPFDPMARPRR